MFKQITELSETFQALYHSFTLVAVPSFVQVSSLLAGTLGFGVKRADIPGLQHHLLDLDPYADSFTEEFWEMVRFFH